MASSQNFKTSKTNCCVVGCSNTYINSPPGTKFYSFPNQIYPGRKEKWLTAIRRIELDGKPWKPTKNSKVCSVHFVGGSKFDHPSHPAFVPSLFPVQYKKQKSLTECSESRFKRRIQRVSAIPVEENLDIEEHVPEQSKDFCMQTDPCTNIILKEERTVILFCHSDGNNANMQTDIFDAKPNVPKQKVVVKLHKNVLCGPDAITPGFSGFQSVKDNDELRGLCGVTLEVFAFFLENMTQTFSKLSRENRLMLFLVKIKLGLSFAALGVLFGVHRTTASNHFFAVLQDLILKCNSIVFWPSKFAIRKLLPESFKNYPDVRVIIDCTELRCERPAEVDQRVLLYSEYKGSYTLKYLIGITPNGFISYISNGYGGRTTDTYITSDCGFLDLLVPGDIVMADKGFPLIKSDFDKKSVELIMPPFATPGRQFSKEEVDETYNIASVRIHVERGIARIRTYHILDKVTIDILPHMDNIIRMCCILVNLQLPIIKAA